MQLTKEQIKQYKELYKERFDFELTDEEIIEKSTSLVRMIELTYKPITEKEFKQLQKRRKELKIKK